MATDYARAISFLKPEIAELKSSGDSPLVPVA
ncbi:hypothetical protein BamIOP4010DRAFT_3585 [Burkholderia ambifaria IOP40-10]|uniref:Uncharacterized protein n=1 Tax=Burkholderia ambifaria IOP40-10 TaxID=396596 RepID=B1FHS5_9BURK|nr:hypothetical protein BamIOP4010DRAFT_3585 [Burkholderia ambifaria IOP40-10]